MQERSAGDYVTTALDLAYNTIVVSIAAMVIAYAHDPDLLLDPSLRSEGDRIRFGAGRS